MEKFHLLVVLGHLHALNRSNLNSPENMEFSGSNPSIRNLKKIQGAGIVEFDCVVLLFGRRGK